MGDSNRFASASLTAGQLNAIVKKLGGHDMALRFLRDELSVSEPIRSWREEDGVIYFSVTSDGTTGEDWIKWSEDMGFDLENHVKEMLLSPDFKPTSGITTEVAVLRGNLFKDNDRIAGKIRAYAEAFRMPDKRRLCKPNAELACLIRKKFANKGIEAMGLRFIAVMHEPINDFDGEPGLLVVNRAGDRRWLDVCPDMPGHIWDRDGGFAYEVSRAKPHF